VFGSLLLSAKRCLSVLFRYCHYLNIRSRACQRSDVGRWLRRVERHVCVVGDTWPHVIHGDTCPSMFKQALYITCCITGNISPLMKMDHSGDRTCHLCKIWEQPPCVFSLTTRPLHCRNYQQFVLLVGAQLHLLILIGCCINIINSAAASINSIAALPRPISRCCRDC